MLFNDCVEIGELFDCRIWNALLNALYVKIYFIDKKQ